MKRLSITALDGIGEIAPGDVLAATIALALSAAAIEPESDDVIVVAQKIVSKAEGRFARLGAVRPSPRARALADVTGKDERLIELILGESSDVLRAVPGVIIVRHRLGHIMANAGIDRSNIGADGEAVLLLPLDPDASARQLRDALGARFRNAPAVIVSDSFGRPWRKGTTNVAIGAAGLPVLLDRRGAADRHGRILEATEIAFADAAAAAAGLVMGEASEGTPVVHIRGLDWTEADQPAAAVLRAAGEDLFL